MVSFGLQVHIMDNQYQMFVVLCAVSSVPCTLKPKISSQWSFLTVEFVYEFISCGHFIYEELISKETKGVEEVKTSN